MAREAAGAVFRLDDGVPGPLPAILGSWVTVPGEMSFATGDASEAPMPVWRVALPAERDAADEALRGAERERDLVARALPQAERRLAMAASPATSFHFAPGGPEAHLSAALAALHERAAQRRTDFHLGDRVLDAWERAYEAFVGALAHLRHLVEGHSWVETAIDGTLVARTLLGRAGDQATAWRSGVEAATHLHARAVALSLDSSVAFVHAFGMALRGLSLVGTAASGPAGMLLALPAVWRFLDDVVAEMRRAGVGEGMARLLP